MQEEGRHITFFVNWAAWHRRNLPWWRKPLFQARIAGVWIFLVWERIGIARGLNGTPQNRNFTVTGSKSIADEITPAKLMAVCLEENDRRLAPYDPRLLRAVLVPTLVRLALRIIGRGLPRDARGNRSRHATG
jgi:hypothetical protein